MLLTQVKGMGWAIVGQYCQAKLSTKRRVLNRTPTENGDKPVGVYSADGRWEYSKVDSVWIMGGSARTPHDDASVVGNT